MSFSEAVRKRGLLKNTPENIETWGKMYTDGIVDGDVLMMTEDNDWMKAGDICIVEIRWDTRLDSPVRAHFFERDGFIEGFCGLPRLKRSLHTGRFIKIN